MKEKAVAELDPVLTKTGFTKAVEMIYEDMGTNMAKNLGVEQYGGNVQIAGTKKVGYAYWCTVNKDMYICKVQNSLNYIDAAYFEAFSNNALLGKLNNLTSSKLDSSRIYCGSANAGSATGSPPVIGSRVDVGKRILFATAIHGGSDARTTNIIVDLNNTDFNSGYVTFKSAYVEQNVVIGVYYLIITI